MQELRHNAAPLQASPGLANGPRPGATDGAHRARPAPTYLAGGLALLSAFAASDIACAAARAPSDVAPRSVLPSRSDPAPPDLGPTGPRAAPLSIDTLRAREFAPRLVREGELPGGRGYRAYLVSWLSGALRVRALVAVPLAARPTRGFPVLVANHGTHPDPPRYGFTAAGLDSRPGDYYRDVPALYAAAGFLVVMPDYRGHNSSQGDAVAGSPLAPAYYAEDVVALLAGLGDLPEADPANVFLWGHSLGGDVTLRVLLSLPRGVPRRVRAAVLWSTVGGDVWEQAAFYARRRALADRAPHAGTVDAAARALGAVDGLAGAIAALDGPYDWQANDPLARVAELDVPLLLHHGFDDASAPYEWSERLAIALRRAGRAAQLVGHRTDAHFFAAPLRAQAVARDVAFFRAAMHAGEGR